MANSAAPSGRVRIRPHRRRSRLLPRIIAAAVVAWGLFLAFYIYRETSVDAQSAVANCIEEHNRDAAGSSVQEAAAIAALCAQSKTAGR